MPKIEVNERLFFSLLGDTYDYQKLEDRLTCAKAKLDEKPDMSVSSDVRTIKIELNDTNRPDLWSRRRCPPAQAAREKGPERTEPKRTIRHSFRRKTTLKTARTASLRWTRPEGNPALHDGLRDFRKTHRRADAAGHHSNAGKTVLELRTKAQIHLHGSIPLRKHFLAGTLQGSRSR